MSTKWKTILSVLLIIVTLASLFLMLSIRMQRQHLDYLIEEKGLSARLLVEGLMENMSSQYRSRVKSFVNPKASLSRKRMIRAFAENDRQALLECSLPLFEVLKKENPYFATIGWALPKRTVFLRVHKPEFFGDDLSTWRKDVMEAMESRKQVAGFAVGYAGMQYRVIQPVFYDEAFVGTVQFGIKASMLLHTLHEKTGTKPVMLVLSGQGDKEKFSTLAKVDYDQFSIQGQDVSLVEQVADQLDFSSDRQRFYIGDQHYVFLTVMEIPDFRNMSIGKIIVPLNISQEIQQTRDFILYSVLMTIVLLLVAFLLLHLSFGTMLEKIFELNHALEQKNQHLIVAKEEVEHVVEERTVELRLANLELQKEIDERAKAEAAKGELENRLRQAQKMEAIGTLAGGIAHDFNNILSAILGYTDLSLLRASPESETGQNLKHIKAAGIRAKNLVSQILAFSRQAEIKQQPLQLSMIVKEALRLLRASLPATIEIKQNITADEHLVYADPTQLHQVVMNLCTNAAHAMSDDGGVLSVSLFPTKIEENGASLHTGMSPGLFLELVVADTGTGIEAKVLDRLFDPFFTTKDVGQGTGMGLAVVHGIIQSLEGAIAVESEVGRGSVFRVLLPECHADYQQDGGKIDHADLPRGSEKILVVDDEPEVRIPLKAMLENLGYRVLTSANGHEALEVFQKECDFDLIVTDFTMPGMSGLELAEKILALGGEVPIVMCTGYSAGVTEEKAFAVGIKKMCMKPLAMHDIGLGVREVLDKHQAG